MFGLAEAQHRFGATGSTTDPDYIDLMLHSPGRVVDDGGSNGRGSTAHCFVRGESLRELASDLLEVGSEYMRGEPRLGIGPGGTVHA